MISSFFQTGWRLLFPETSKVIQNAVLALLRDIREKEMSGIEWCHIEPYISNIPKEENILSIQCEDGYNLLQRAIGFKCVELVKWILNRGCDVNQGQCSLPLHIAAFHGTEEIVELLLKHGARVDLKARMCFPGPHKKNCELSSCNFKETGISNQISEILEIPLQWGADVSVKTTTQQMTVLHVVLLLGRKSAKATLQTLKMLLDHGCRELINEPDTLGNTPLHALIDRYALEESRFGYAQEPIPWSKWDMWHIVRYLFKNGASPSINYQGNSALAYVLRHIKDWEFRYEMLEELLTNGGDPNSKGIDGSVPLMACLVPLIEKDPRQFLAHHKKVFYLNSVLLLCKHGANPNCSSTDNLTPMHVLVFTACDYIILSNEEHKNEGFAFIRKLLVILLQHGLNPNIQFAPEYENAFQTVMDMVV